MSSKNTKENNSPEDKLLNAWLGQEGGGTAAEVGGQGGATAEVRQLGPSAHRPACGGGAWLAEAHCCSLVVRPETRPGRDPACRRGCGGAPRACVFRDQVGVQTPHPGRVPSCCGTLLLLFAAGPLADCSGVLLFSLGRLGEDNPPRRVLFLCGF